MGIRIGSTRIKSLYLGEQKVRAVYLGESAVFVASKLPSAYQEVSYLSAASGNGAYIDLGIAYSGGAEIEIGYRYQGTADLQIFGAAENAGTLRCLLSAEYSSPLYANTSRTFYFTTVQTDSYTTGVYPMRSGLNVGDLVHYRFVLKAGDPLRAYDEIGHTQTDTPYYTVKNYAMTRHLYLLGQNYNTGYRGNGLKQVTLFRYKDQTGTLLRDMVPCYRKSDSTPGMYDLVTNTFFPNAGSGTFTVGPDVT